VIATGFDRKAGHRGVFSTGLQTPVDLHTYTDHLARPVAAAPAEPMREAPPPVMEAPPSLTLGRRIALDLHLSGPASSGGKGGAATGEFDPDLSTRLDVPAFLRRQN
jgi:hypothetical protein